MTSNADSPVEIGQTIAGKYRVDRVLGAGGMGVVVAATHVTLEQRVALKFLLPQALANADVVARFQREARAAVKIQSEHVARVLDVGTLESGAPYMVMEYLEGSDLAQRIASDGPLPVADAVRFLLEACEALAEAHAAGIVHRDLKPANLFLARRADKTSMVKVLDFGISKLSGPGAASGGAMTSTQAVMGSPYYMSPEQLVSAKNVDARSDVWSLGVVLYEALVGGPPFGGDTMPEIVAQILQAPVSSIAARRPDVPPAVDGIVAKCMAKEPARRYRDVAELARDLAALSPGGERSVERISRVLTGSAEAPAPAAPTKGVDARGGTVAMGTSSPEAHPGTSQSAWGSTHVGPPRRTALVAALAGAAALSVAALGAVFVARSKPRAEAPGPVGLVAPAVASPSVVAAPPATVTVAAPAESAAVVSSPATVRPLAHPTASARPATVARAATSAVAVKASSVPRPKPSATATAATNSLDMGLK